MIHDTFLPDTLSLLLLCYSHNTLKIKCVVFVFSLMKELGVIISISQVRALRLRRVK